MNGKELLDKMDLVDPKFVQEAEKVPAKKPIIWVRWVAAAAGVCLVLNVSAFMIWGGTFFQMNSPAPMGPSGEASGDGFYEDGYYVEDEKDPTTSPATSADGQSTATTIIPRPTTTKVDVPNDPNKAITCFVGGIPRRYQGYSCTEDSVAIVWPWEQQTIWEQYTNLKMNGQEYSTTSRAVSPTLLEKSFGTFEVTGYDWYDKEHGGDGIKTLQCDVKKIKGVAEKRAVAVQLKGTYYVFNYREEDPPATLGDLLQECGMPDTVQLGNFTLDPDPDDAYYTLKSNQAIWQILKDCAKAPYVADTFDHPLPAAKNSISFTATSEALGVYKHVISVDEAGYLRTNILDYGYNYQIGKEVAKQIIKIAKENAEKMDYEPFKESILGEVTRITKDAIYVDDTVLCKDEKEGITFKIPLDDIRIRRYVESDATRLKVGNHVRITFTGQVDAKADYLVQGADSIYKVKLYDDGTWIMPE